MSKLKGKIAWVTGAGSGIGEAGAKALAKDGALVVLTGRRKDVLQAVATAIAKAGGKAEVQAGDATDAAAINKIAAAIVKKHKRLDILVNNAGSNVLQRSWAQLTAEGAQTVLDANLRSAFICAIAALPQMRAQKDGVLIHTASWAGRFVSTLSGAAYTSAKHAMVAMSHSINMEECVNNIRSSVLCPAEVATPILDKRPVPVTKAERARMLQSEDMGDLIRYIAGLPAHVCVNEVLISPTWNRGYVAALQRGL